MSMDIATLSKLHDLLVKTGNSTDVAGITTLFAQLAQIRAYTDTLESTLGAISDVAGTSSVVALLKQINNFVDTVETSEASIKAKTDLIGLAADAAGTATLFAQMNQIRAYTDTIESVLGTNGDASNTNASMWAMLKSLYGKSGVLYDKSAMNNLFVARNNSVFSGLTNYQSLLSVNTKGYLRFISLMTNVVTGIKITVNGVVKLELVIGQGYPFTVSHRDEMLSIDSIGNFMAFPAAANTNFTTISSKEVQWGTIDTVQYNGGMFVLLPSDLFFDTLLIELKTIGGTNSIIYSYAGGSL